MRSACGPDLARLQAGNGLSAFHLLGADDDFRSEIIGQVTSIEANTECVGECRIGAVAPLSDTLRLSRRLGYGALVT
jgi:hypothetical protein